MKRSSLTSSEPTVQREWALRLSLGPTLWPPRTSPEFLRARSLVPEGPPSFELGETAIVSVSRDKSTVALWKLRTHPTGAKTPGAIGFTPAAEQDWREVVSWIPRLVPVLWQPVATVARLEIEAIRLAGWTTGRREIEDDVLDGRSYGLSMALSAASLMFRRRLKADVLATAAIENGEIAPAGEIGLKVRGIVALAPAIRRLLVHPENVDEATRAAKGALRIVPIRSLGAALREGFGQRLETVLVRAGRDPHTRSSLVARFVSLATGPRTLLVDWAPVRRAAHVALGHWELSARDQRHLRMAAAFALRHESSDGRVALPHRRWLASLPRPTRLGVLSHLVGQVMYAVSPAPTRVVALVREHVQSDLREASTQDLRLLGALARLESVTGRPADSLRTQLRLGEQFCDLEAFHDVSVQISEGYRLAGALRRAKAFGRAAALEERANACNALDAAGQTFADLARGQALVGLGRGSEAEATLVHVAQARPRAAHLRWSAMRWLSVRARQGRTQAQGDPWRRTLQTAARSGAADAHSAPLYLTLLELDDALAVGDARAAQAALDSLRRREPGIVGHLVRAARLLGTEPAIHVARFYPD